MVTLIEAIREGNLDSVHSFLEKGADPNECTRLGLSSLHLAAVHDRMNVMEMLIEYGGKINMLTGWGSSALHLAANSGSLSVVMVLLKYKASVNIRDNNNDTPLHLACTEGLIDMAKELLLAGADQSIKNNAGNTALEESIESEIYPELLEIMNSTIGQEKIFSMSADSERLPHLSEGYKPLLNQTEYVPDFDVPTNESYSSIINEFSLPAGKSTISPSFRSDNTSGADILKNYNGTKSMEKAQKFSFLNDSPMIMSDLVVDLTAENSKSMNIPSNMSFDQSFSSSSCSLSHLLKFDQDKITGSSIDSSVYPETYQLYKQLNPDNQIGSFSSQLSYSFSAPHSELNIQSFSSNNKESDNNLVHGSEKSSVCESCYDKKEIDIHVPTQFLAPVQSKIDSIISNLSPILEHSDIASVTAVLSNIAASIVSPWPSESKEEDVNSKKEWICGEDFVLVSNTPLNVQNVQDREGSCSLVFKILHQKYGPLVLKMMVNLLNESDHDTGQSGTIFLKKQFSAEHTVPISLAYHPNIVQMLHCYNSTTTPFKRFLPLLVPPGLDVEIDMASRTSFFAMPEFPFSLKNYVNKFVEQKVKLGLTNRNRIKDELQLVSLILLQCLFGLQHLKKHNVAHRDIKLDNIMMHHSGQAILIDFGMAVQLYNHDGSPTIATERNEIIAGNPVAWSPEISHHHHSFSGPVAFTSVYEKSDLFTLGMTFLSVLEVFGFVRKKISGKIEISNDLTDVPNLQEYVLLLDKMTDHSLEERISIENALVSLGKIIFFKDCTNHQHVLHQYLKISLQEVQISASITDIEKLTALSPLYVAVSKQFVSTVDANDLISKCIPTGTE